MWRRGTVLSLIAWAASIKKFIPKNAAECRIKKTFVDIQDAGAMKIIKRKKALKPDQIEDLSKKEQD